MESLQYLLKHPYVVLNKVSEALYEQDSQAFYSRLRSRASGRHRFKEEEATNLLKIFTKFAAQISKMAAKVEKYMQSGGVKKDVLPMSLLQNPMLNLKPMLSKAAEGNQLNYYKLYDCLRNKSKLSSTELQSIVDELNNFAADIQQHIELAKKEAKTYPFGFGRGSNSHILA